MAAVREHSGSLVREATRAILGGMDPLAAVDSVLSEQHVMFHPSGLDPYQLPPHPGMMQPGVHPGTLPHPPPPKKLWKSLAIGGLVGAGAIGGTLGLLHVAEKNRKTASAAGALPRQTPEQKAEAGRKATQERKEKKAREAAGPKKEEPKKADPDMTVAHIDIDDSSLKKEEPKIVSSPSASKLYFKKPVAKLTPDEQEQKLKIARYRASTHVSAQPQPALTPEAEAKLKAARAALGLKPEITPILPTDYAEVGKLPDQSLRGAFGGSIERLGRVFGKTTKATDSGTPTAEEPKETKAQKRARRDKDRADNKAKQDAKKRQAEPTSAPTTTEPPKLAAPLSGQAALDFIQKSKAFVPPVAPLPEIDVADQLADARRKADELASQKAAAAAGAGPAKEVEPPSPELEAERARLKKHPPGPRKASTVANIAQRRARSGEIMQKFQSKGMARPGHPMASFHGRGEKSVPDPASALHAAQAGAYSPERRKLYHSKLTSRIKKVKAEHERLTKAHPVLAARAKREKDQGKADELTQRAHDAKVHADNLGKALTHLKLTHGGFRVALHPRFETLVSWVDRILSGMSLTEGLNGYLRALAAHH